MPGLGVVCGLGGDPDPAVVLVVGNRIVDHVVDHAADQRLAALDPGAVRAAVVPHGELHGADGVLPRGQGRLHRGVERQRGVPGQVTVLRAGQDEESLEEPLHLVEFGAQPPGEHRGLRRDRFRLGLRDVERGAHGGQRGAQLVRGVGDEPALGGERALQPGQQLVDGVGEILDLVQRAGDGEPLVQVVRRDPAGRGGHGAQRAQHPVGDEPAERDRHHHHDGQRGRRSDQQRVPQILVRLAGLGGELTLQVVDPGLGLGLGQGLRERRRRRAAALALVGGAADGGRRSHRDQAGDGQQADAAQQSQQAVERGQPEPGGVTTEQAHRRIPPRGPGLQDARPDLTTA